MHFTKKTIKEKRSNFVEKLKSKKLLRFPGAYNPLCAKLIAEIGFDGVYISGGVMSNDLGLPDIGLTTLDQVSYRASQITKVTDLPTIVDADTGFNDCSKTISTFEKKGLAGCHIEDQVAEKRCGHLDNKELITKNEMVKKIKQSVEARKDNNFLIIVRTDANTVEGIDKTLDRIKAYEDAGADMIFPEAMKDEKEFEKVRKISKNFLLANMTEFGKSKLLNKTELENLGYNLVIYPVTTQRLAMQSVENGLKSIFKDGHQNNIIDKMQTRKRLYELVEYEKYNTPGKKITDFSTEGHE
jgi:methylisocitrate lyase